MKSYVLGTFVFITLAAAWLKQPIETFLFKQTHGGLLNYDHGILSVEDLRFADLDSLPPKPRNDGYPYWQCFPANRLKIWCDYPEPRDGPSSSLNLEVKIDSEFHFYGLNHAVSSEVCDELLSQLFTVLKDESQFCINGTRSKLESRRTLTTYYSWFFYRLKTKKGYAHYVHVAGMPDNL